MTEGLDGLRDRFAAYRGLGARFAKWRAVISIGDGIPSEYAVWVNAHALARYAALAQEAGLVPIVEPEVLMDGEHSIDRSYHVTSQVQNAVFTELHDQRVELTGMLLKPNMVLAGYGAAEQAGVETVAGATIRCLRHRVPPAVAGVVFLSGGQSPETATEHLNAMNALGPHPWQLSFSYGRALQDPVMQAWRGEAGNVEAAQAAYLKRARLNGAARSADYDVSLERG